MGSDANEYDVAIVGGGPAGCSAGVFTAREGLDTVIFDRGRSSIRQCAYLENYLGFPEGIDIETFYDLMHDHVAAAGCEVVSDLVESVEPTERGFVVEPQEGESVRARRVVAATRYDGEYLRGLDDEAAMFETYERDGETHETFDKSYADTDGTTPVEGLYVVSPSEEDKQAIMAAGRGARVAHRVIADDKLDGDWWPAVTEENVDWVRREAERTEEWTDRDRWVEYFDEYYGADAPVGADTERYRAVRDAFIDESMAAYISASEADARASKGHETLADRLDVETMVSAVDDAELLAAIDDDAIREYVDGDGLRPTSDD
ncbi:NAD(P)/FAD-dependent oxidoreductase [Natronomonas halophila]|uniref:NAD(P)/FAD-dependent oxidoreductase n=1 Tax=Natronomonas halophila TaxID=2747817 RepID=UPI0015B71D3D|nr:NAD(P)/FAD-dependent oxidoreductase [Natronomonas halophila]QLD84897.1 NAD(P)/FAD-dependent oxidoreductase [Natronomonas halophila]